VLPEARFVIVGDGELRFELEQEAAVLGLEGRVMFVGWQPDLSIVYADLDLFTLTSLNEGVGLVLVEAMAAGCPVVATRVGGVPDVIQDGITGRLVESGDVEGLARAMREMLTDRARTRQMAEAARADVSQRYTVEALVRHTEALYERLLHEKGLA
jgi:glycosyltransferase involved in cell wall biosynthesis